MIYVKFTVDLTKMHNVHVSGRFNAMGGSNDIQAFLADADNFQNLQSGLQAQTLYSTAKTSFGNINTAIPLSGDYYFVLNNRFSNFTDKYVSGDIELTYDE
jgi:hypothetical protein